MGDVRDVVMEFAENIGIGGLSFDANNMAGIQFDDLAVNIHADSDAGEITLFLAIGEVPARADAKAAVYAYLLKNNNFSRNTGGGVLGVDEEERTAYFSHRFAAATVSAARLEQIIEAFLNLADVFVAGFRAATDSGDAGASGPAPAGLRV